MELNLEQRVALSRAKQIGLEDELQLHRPVEWSGHGEKCCQACHGEPTPCSRALALMREIQKCRRFRIDVYEGRVT